MVTDLPRANLTIWQTPLICIPPLYIAVTLEPTMQYLNWVQNVLLYATIQLQLQRQSFNHLFVSVFKDSIYLNIRNNVQ